MSNAVNDIAHDLNAEHRDIMRYSVQAKASTETAEQADARVRADNVEAWALQAAKVVKRVNNPAFAAVVAAEYLPGLLDGSVSCDVQSWGIARRAARLAAK